MAKVIKKRLSWSASPAADVVGYKVYWNTNTSPDYDSQFVQTTGTSLVLPDGIPALPVEIEANYVFGITAVDDVGNESDLTISGAIPLDFTPPLPPTGLVVENV